MASGGWNYRTAYFMDFDGKYYKTTISVAEGQAEALSTMWGKMKEALPKLMALPARPSLCGGMLPLIVYAKVMTIVKKNLPTTSTPRRSDIRYQQPGQPQRGVPFDGR